MRTALSGRKLRMCKSKGGGLDTVSNWKGVARLAGSGRGPRRLGLKDRRAPKVKGVDR